MKLFRRATFFVIAMSIAGCIYAYWLVNDQGTTKTGVVLAANEQIVGDQKRGEYVASMGGCIACHTNFAEGGATLAGGVPIVTPFGTLYSPNITSDSTAGIGQWTTDEFLIAMSVGVSPEDKHYYPAFPYISYSVMSVQDLVDLKTWLDTVEPSSKTSLEHDVVWPVSYRPLMLIWKALFFDPLRVADFADRGSYLVNGPGHCAECHAPRNLLGGITSRSLSGNSRGPDGESVPGITSNDLSEWSAEDLELFLEVGITVSGDFTGGHMTDVIEYGTSQLNNEDRSAIAHYLLSDANEL